MLFCFSESGVIQAVGLHFVMCESQTFGRVSFAVLEVKNGYLKYVYMIVIVIVGGGGRLSGGV